MSAFGRKVEHSERKGTTGQGNLCMICQATQIELHYVVLSEGWVVQTLMKCITTKNTIVKSMLEVRIQ